MPTAHFPIFLMWAITVCPNIVLFNGYMLLKDWYQEFLCVSRVWSHLTCVRQQGQASAHNVDSILSHRHPNSLAVYCPTCPEVGFNVFREFLVSLSPTQRLALSIYWCKLIANLSVYRHKVTKFLCGDGNFRMVHKMNGKFALDDVALADGNAYFSDMDLFKV